MRMRVKMVARRRKRLVREVRIRGGIIRLASLKVPRMMSNRTMGKPAAWRSEGEENMVLLIEKRR